DRTMTWGYVEPIQVVMAGAIPGQLVPAFAGAGASLGVSGVVPNVQLNVSQSKLADLHPADIADILEQLDVEDAGSMLERVDTETAADALHEVETALQSEQLSELDPEQASDLLEMLALDAATCLLADHPPARADR